MSPPTQATPWHAASADETLAALDASAAGLAEGEALRRLAAHGANRIPSARAPGWLETFAAQFASPLIYVLLAAGGMSLWLGHADDAAFIGVIVLANAVIGAYQEHRAQRAVRHLRRLVPHRARVRRDGELRLLPAERLVPGDIVQLSSGDRVPADLRLVAVAGLELDESLLTGESLPVAARAAPVVAAAPLAERFSMAFAGTVAARGRATGVVVATGERTELGQLAGSIAGRAETPTPLTHKLTGFARALSVLFVACVAAVAALEWAQGAPWREIVTLAAALAVAVVPEGLPVALTVVLAVATARMARRHVIIRRLAAAEALGSCTVIATDKTGTLTRNELEASLVALPDGSRFTAAGPAAERAPSAAVRQVAEAAVLCNEAAQAVALGSSEVVDALDLALLGLGRHADGGQAALLARWPLRALLPYEPERGYAASLHVADGASRLLVKGAPEIVAAMCEGLEPVAFDRQLAALAADGYRLIACAERACPQGVRLEPAALHGMRLLGLIGLRDPVRAGARESIARCHAAGVRVAMVTGDHPATALSVARELGIAASAAEVATGYEVAAAVHAGPAALAALIGARKVFARMRPEQKLDLVQAWRAAGEFVAVTGDGVNDAPALVAANVGAAMGRRGSDVARESADLVLTDDDFASIAAGVEEGRIAYGNLRKVLFLLLSTGVAEVVLFLGAAAAGQPLPLTAVQLLWLNLVSEGVQHVGLAFEPAEGDEMRRPPRRPDAPLLDRALGRRILWSAVTMGGVGWWYYSALLAAGVAHAAAQNLLLLLLVLFENLQAMNARAERRSLFGGPWRGNPVLLWGTLAAQAVHVTAMHLPGLNTLLGIGPLPWTVWAGLLPIAATVIVVSEIEKFVARRGVPAASRP